MMDDLNAGILLIIETTIENIPTNLGAAPEPGQMQQKGLP